MVIILNALYVVLSLVAGCGKHIVFIWAPSDVSSMSIIIYQSEAFNL